LEKLETLLRDFKNLKEQMTKYTYMQCDRDTVHASSKAFPYCDHVIKIGGISNKTICKRVEEIKSLYYAKLLEVNRMKDEAEEYISTIPDPDLRLILQGRYVNHLKWREIEREFAIPERAGRWKLNKWRIEKSYLSG
jgi:hypothetical protein